MCNSAAQNYEILMFRRYLNDPIVSSRAEALFPQNSSTGIEPAGIVGHIDSLLLATKADL